MVRFGTVGTGWIVDDFIFAAKMDDRFELCCVCSRTSETASTFAAKHGAKHSFTSLEKMAESGLIDAVYIASPNTFHAQQAECFMKHGVAVLCEKPMATSAAQGAKMIETARENNVLLMHAVRNLFEPRLRILPEYLKQIGKVRQINASRCRYSSQYTAFRQGKQPNAFNPALGSGALMDMGVYLLQPLIYFFGKPDTTCTTKVLLENGIDGAGAITAQYKEMQAVLSFSKIANSFACTEIQGEDGTIFWEINQPKAPPEIHLALRGQETKMINIPQTKPSLYYEASHFMDLMEAGKTESEISRPADVLAILEIMDTYNTVKVP